jgi:putative endonuclease
LPSLDRRELGRRAEELVAELLRARGCEIVARNLRLQRGEIDLVARRGGRLWFVEVKCRRRRDVGPPHRAVDARKRAALFAAAREYVVAARHRGDWGFLVASVVGPPEGPAPSVSLIRWSIHPPAR